MAGLIPKAEFIGIESLAHLAAGGEAPVLRSHLGAASRFLLDKGVGMPGRERMFGVVEDARSVSSGQNPSAIPVKMTSAV